MSMKAEHASPHPGSARGSFPAVVPDGDTSNGPPAGRASTAATESRESAGHHLPAADELAAMAGIKLHAARERLRRFRQGEIGRDRLFATTRKRYRYDDLPTPERIVAATGIKLESARVRLRRYLRGEITRERLLELPEDALKRRRHSIFDPILRLSDWGDLGLGPRKRLEDIPGPTELERRTWNERDVAR